MQNRFISIVILGVFISSFAAVRAVLAVDVEVHGFFTVGYADNDSSTQYLGSINGGNGNFTALSDVGAQLGAALTDRLSAKIQLVAEGRQNQALIPSLDLAQIRYLLVPGHDLLLGQIRLPLFMISDYRMVGALYPWNVPPSEVYDVLPIGAVGAGETFDGANVVSQLADFSGWNLQSEVYGGGSSTHLTPPGEEIDGVSKRIFGANLSLSTSQFLLRVSYMNCLNQITTIVQQGGAVPQDSSLGTLQFFSAGSKWEPSDFLFMAEAVHIAGDNPKFASLYSGYFTAGYYLFGRKLMVHGTVAPFENASGRNPSLTQITYNGGVNFQLGDSAVIKLEGQHTVLESMSGPPGTPPTVASSVNLLLASVSATF